MPSKTDDEIKLQELTAIIPEKTTTETEIPGITATAARELPPDESKAALLLKNDALIPLPEIILPGEEPKIINTLTGTAEKEPKIGIPVTGTTREDTKGIMLSSDVMDSYDNQDYTEDDYKESKWFDENERLFDTEDLFYVKLNQKNITRGYKRPVNNLRADTRRKYHHFRVQKSEKKRKPEKFRYDYISPPFLRGTSSLNNTGTTAVTAAQTNTPASSTQCNTTTPAPASDNAKQCEDDAKYLSLKEERDYQEAVRQSSVQLAPTTGLSLQQILDMCNRDLTPEDYELLLRLDEAVEKKTVKQETLTTLMEKLIDNEAQLSEVCTVCMFNYEMGDNVKCLPCNHFFHVDCIIPYLSSYGQACPVCKSKVLS